MNTWAIIPMKSFRRAKSRLAPAMDAGAREALARGLFERCLDAVDGQVDQVLVLTDGDDVVSACRGHRVLFDEPGLGLGALVDRALSAVPATRGLVLMADLPEIVPEDVEAMLEHTHAVAPDRHALGTNALVLPLPGSACFGRIDSFERHRLRGPVVVERPGLALDLDLPGDLRPDARAGSLPSRLRSA